MDDLIAEAFEQAASSAVLLGEDIEALDQTIRSDLFDYRRAIGKSPAQPRSGSVILKILKRLAQEPVMTINSVSAEHGVARAAAHRALVELVDAGILRKTKNHKGKIICYTADRHLAYMELAGARRPEP